MIVSEKCETRWDDYKSDCSGFVRAVAGDLGIGLIGQADEIVSQIQAAPWAVLADGIEAKAKADAGYLVVGGKKSTSLTPPRTNGHVVVVVSGPLDSGKYPTACWGTLGGVGRKNATVNWAFNTADRDSVIYAFIAL